jgi:hypothetical protein
VEATPKNCRFDLMVGDMGGIAPLMELTCANSTGTADEGPVSIWGRARGFQSNAKNPNLTWGARLNLNGVIGGVAKLRVVGTARCR